MAVLFLSTLLGLKGQHSCGTDEYYAQAVAANPAIKLLEKQFNDEAKRVASAPSNRATVFTIPVVFHVIHTNGIDNISKEQILDQLRILNADFSYTNANKSKIRSAFTAVAADCQIKFVLASIDPNGNCTDGINRVYSTLGTEVSQTTEEVKQLVQWNYQKYLNIWVVNSIKTSGAGTILGYAQFPWMPSKSRDGIVIRHDRVGSIGTAAQSDSGRTLTHELGHWLGLYHTFQDGCNGGDDISDTPPVASTFTNANCPTNGNSCSNDNPDLPDMWENYMDYSDGKCMAMFTLGQKSRMHAYLSSSPRNANVSASNLIATGITLSSGVPIANFTASKRIVCAGAPVTFYDISCKSAVTARSWTLPGSSIPSSTDKQPVVVYQTPGTYKVTLVVQNGSGSNTKAVDSYIQVVSPNNGINPNFEEGFETNDLEARGFVSVSQSKWTVVSNASFTGSRSLKAPITTSTALGENFSFVLPPVNVSILRNAVPGPKFTFRVAYAPATDPATNETEVLRVYASTDCGNSFVQILERTGTGLAYSGAPVTNNFTPTGSSQWKLIGVTSLAQLNLDTSKNLIFRIDVISAKGNPVYIDNINISSFNSGILAPEESFASVDLYPNPASTVAHLNLITTEVNRTQISLIDQTGRVVSNIYTGNLPVGENSFEIPAPLANTGALYFVKITSDKGQITKPITFAP